MDNENRIIEALGGTTRCAQIFDIKPASVSEWRKRGIPKARLHSIRLMRPDLFAPDATSAPTEGVGSRCAELT
jgi:hypothetical protein